MVAISPAAAAEVELSKGRLTVTDFIATQVIAVKNNTTKRISTIYVECGFFHANTLLAAARYHAENVEAGQTAYIEVTLKMPPRLTDRNVGSTLSHDKLAAEKGGKSPAYDASNEIRCGSRRSGAALADWPRATTCRPRLYACGAEGYRLGAGRETRNLCRGSGSLAMLAAILHYLPNAMNVAWKIDFFIKPSCSAACTRHLTKRSTIGSFPPLKLAVRQLIVRQRSCLHSERRKWRPRGRVSASQRSMLIWRCWREKRSKHLGKCSPGGC